jgi:hypothetical protein
VVFVLLVHADTSLTMTHGTHHAHQIDFQAILVGRPLLHVSRES